MNVLLTVNAAWNIWNFRRPLVAGLLDDGHQVTVLAPRDDSVKDLERMGCRFVDLEMNAKGLNPLWDMMLLRRMRRHLRAERPDVVLSWTIKNNIFGALAARSLGVTFVPNVSGLGTAFLSGNLLQAVAEGLYRRAFVRPPVVFFQNPDDRDLFLSRALIRPDQAALLPGSGIDLRHFLATELPPEGEPPIFLMIGRVLRDKGVLEFVQAARQVKARVPNARFQLLGAVDSENRTAIDAATVKGWEAEGILEHLGTAPDVRPFIAAASCVVLPSYREGAPRTLIEAAAMGRPLIATDVPGCRSVVKEGRTGLLCKPRCAESLAEAYLSFLAMSRPQQAEMGRLGRLKMEREFDEGIVIKAYKDVLVRVGAPC